MSPKRQGIALPLKQVFIALLVMFSVQTHAANISGGEWVGGSDLFNSPVYMNLIISENVTKGEANIPQWKIVKRELLKLKIEDDRISFEIYSTTGVPFVAEGKFTNGVIEGSISRGDKKGKFHLVLVKKIPSAILGKYVGCYNIPDPANKHAVIPHLITYSASGHLRFVNLTDGSTTLLLPLTDNKFFFVGSILTRPNPSSSVVFTVNKKGVTDKFSIHIDGRPDMQATKIAGYKVEEIKVQSNDHELAGNLLMPAKGKKNGVVVIVPGSQGLNRDENSPYEEFNTFLSNGYGLLIYDKPGSGQSGGNWQTSSFEDLAEDVLAFVKLLNSRNDVDQKRIGVWGFSQGATIAPLAASMSKDISFVIMQSGGGLGPAAAEMNQQVARLQQQKFSDTAINEAIEFMKLQFKSVNSDVYRDSLEARIPEVKTKTWSKVAFGMLPRDNWMWKFWKPIVDFNPVVSLEKVKVPVLVIFGAADPLVPKDSLSGMISTITDALKRGGNNDVTVKTFDKANHNLFVEDEKKESKLAEGYDELLKGFILRFK